MGAHLIVLKNEKVLCLNEPPLVGENPFGLVLVWNPLDNSFAPVNLPTDSFGDPIVVFCAGHSQLPDGRIVFVGGGRGYGSSHEHTVIFDPDADLSDPWSVMVDMPGGTEFGKRWYPTCTTLGDGTVLVLGGDPVAGPHTADVPLIFDPLLNPPLGQYMQLSAALQHLPFYPFVFQLSNQLVFYAGVGHEEETSGISQTLDRAAQVWGDVASAASTEQGSAVMYRPNLIMKAGGNVSGGGATGDVAAIDPTTTPSEWGPLAAMAGPRVQFNLVVLPDGDVLAVTGVVGGVGVLEPELYDPAANTWTDMAAMDAPMVCTLSGESCTRDADCPQCEHCVKIPRGHHSSAILLADARVLIAGGQGTFLIAECNNSIQTAHNRTAQIFSPRYLFDAAGPAARPIIQGVSGPGGDAVCYGQPVTVTTGPNTPADQVTAVSLLRLGAVTHGFDEDQRFMSLTITGAMGNELSVDAPANGNTAPPGYYMLFILTGDAPSRVPSEAAIVQVADPMACLGCQLHGDVFPYDQQNPNQDPVGNCVVNIDDLLVILNAFAVSPNYCPALGGTFPDSSNLFPCGEGCVPGSVVDIDDVLAELGAFAGNFVCPRPCAPNPCSEPPAGVPPPSPPLGGSEFGSLALLPPPIVYDDPIITLVANPTTIARGESATVEGFITGGTDLRAYQVALSVTGGTSGTLDLETLTINIVRQDYVFPGFSSFTATDVSGVRLGAALDGVGIDPGFNKYLGTFTFRASSDASGTFTVDFRTAETFLRDSNIGSIAWQSAGSANIVVQTP